MEFEEIFVDAPWGKISVLCYGQIDWPIVVMVHGLQDSASTFFPLLEYFPRDMRLILPELPSCGNSTPFPAGIPLQLMDFISPIKLVIDHFELETFIYIGHSMGFQIGYIFNTIYPDYVTRFISIDSITYPPIEPEMFSNWFRWTYESFYEKNNYKMFCSDPKPTSSLTYEKALAIVMKGRGLTKTAGKAVLERGLIPSGDGFRFCWDQRLKLINFPLFSTPYLLKLFGDMKIPHLTIIASESDRLFVIRLHMMEKHFVNNPHYRLVMVEGNHDLHLNNPKEVASHIVPFLKGVDASKEETFRLVDTYNKIYDYIEGDTVKSKL